MNFTQPFIQDDRTRKYLAPVRIMWEGGDVSNSKCLVGRVRRQMDFVETDVMTLKNGEDGENAAILIDFGREIHGGVRIQTYNCIGMKTPRLRLSFGESATEAMSDIGYKNTTNEHSIRDMTIILNWMSDSEFGTTGYRFLRIELLEKNVSVEINAIMAAFVYRDLEYKGSFECDNARLNEIYDICAYTCHVNMQTLLWDGIKRDRAVWIGDMHPEMLTIRTVFGYDYCVTDSLTFIKEKTELPAWMNTLPTYSMWWVIILYDWYLHNGKLDFVLEQKDFLEKLMAQLCDEINEKGEDTLPRYFLDWPSDGRPEAAAGVRAIMDMALRKGALILDIYGDTELAARCRKVADILKANIPAPYHWKQSAALMTLAGHIDAKTAAEEVLCVGGARGLSTFMSYYMLTAVSMAGRTAEALDMLETFYGAMIDRGATTFWEDFNLDWLENSGRIDEFPQEGQEDIHGDNGAFCYVGFRHSLCHGWASAPTAFLAERVLGFTILEPGCKKMAIRPDLGNLSWAKGTYPTPYGIITVSHKKNADGTITTEYSAPKEIEIVK